jgi:phospholipase/lecithinase/hemolysin
LKNKILEIAGLAEEGWEGEEKMMLEAIERMVAFGKNYRKKGSVEPAKHSINCKYKGKEIKTLLKENEQTAFRNSIK